MKRASKVGFGQAAGSCLDLTPSIELGDERRATGDKGRGTRNERRASERSRAGSMLKGRWMAAARSSVPPVPCRAVFSSGVGATRNDVALPGLIRHPRRTGSAPLRLPPSGFFAAIPRRRHPPTAVHSLVSPSLLTPLELDHGTDWAQSSKEAERRIDVAAAAATPQRTPARKTFQRPLTP
ncbi:uncharacterized protein PSFLO_04567 [Pseudozyma flocculosa]|uniref:Uncharacterized protein n=1 Tax=Pseudozyma flocculosa TaxID=84751 RepID=A0A5C3F3T1_9BASI|nr:uncharacterized protein PSFLO_04567 [Pseudozyma flocculosa]